MRIFKSLIAVVLLLGLSCQTTQACSCGVTQLNARDDAARIFKEATVVFEGEVLSIEPAKPGDLSNFLPAERENISNREPVAAEITFRVLRQYKGDPKLEIRMYTGARDSAEPCQARYHAGDRWFIYGFLKKDGKLYFTDCNRSTTLDEAGAELRYARGEPATQEDLMPRSEKSRLENEPELKENGATLSGTIRRFDRSGMGRALLTIWRLDEEDQKERPGEIYQDANPDGTFVVRYLWPGIYFLSARITDWEKPTFFVGRTATFTVKQRQSLDGLEIVLNAEPLAEVRIHIEPSKPLHDQVEAELWDVDNDSGAVNPKLYPDNQSAEPDSSGLAVLKGLQFGTYHLAVSNFVVNDAGYRVEAACHQTDEKLVLKLDKPIVEITVHLDCKGK
jgi:hypothetical protein